MRLQQGRRLIAVMDKKKLLRYATLAVPRYTSYPTAADFSGIDDATRINWLEQVETGQSVSLYIHIPYCSELCHYCGCFTKIVRRSEVIHNYVDILVRDIRLQASFLKARPRVVYLHWGGGTPSILSEESFRKIMAALHEVFVFDSETEHAIELDPRMVHDRLATLLADIGVNRASLGVQDVNPVVQKAIGRIQPVGDVERAGQEFAERRHHADQF